MRADLYSAIKSNMPPLSGCRDAQLHTLMHFLLFATLLRFRLQHRNMLLLPPPWWKKKMERSLPTY